jgi:hypothetical protein
LNDGLRARIDDFNCKCNRRVLIAREGLFCAMQV